MEKRVLHAIIISLIGTSMIKTAYGIIDFKILIAINILLMSSALYAYIRLAKKEDDQQRNQDDVQKDVADILGGLSEKLLSVESNLVFEKNKQTNEIFDQFGKAEKKFVSKFDEGIAVGMEGLAGLSEISQRSSEILESKLESDHEQINTLIKVGRENSALLEGALKVGRENSVLIEDSIKVAKENANLLNDTIKDSAVGINEQLNDFKIYKQEIESVIEETIKAINDVVNQIKSTQGTLSENLTELSEDVQGGLGKINRNIDSLADKNSEISEDYQTLWRDLSKNLGETAFNNHQFLVLLQDHYKALKQVAAGL